MSLLWFPILLFSFLIQAAITTVPEDGLSVADKARLSRETNIERRISVYREASTRLNKTVEQSIKNNEFEPVPDYLKAWLALLDVSVKDIEANVNRKKKSKALIDYEIQLRKSISAMLDARLKAPVDQQDVFDAWSTRTEEVRRNFVDILFQNKG